MGRRKPDKTKQSEQFSASDQNESVGSNNDELSTSSGTSSFGVVRYIASWFNLSTLSTILACLYLYSTITSMRSLIYPFEGVEIVEGAQRIKPLWNENTPIKVYAYMSTSSKPNLKAFNRSDGNLPMLWEISEEDGVVYGWETTSPEKRLELIAPDELGASAQIDAEKRLVAKAASLDASGGSFILAAASFLFDEQTAEETAMEAKGQMLTVSGKRVWKAIREGKELYLHVHVLLDDSSMSDEVSKITKDVQDQTKSLYGTVALVKFEPPSIQRTKRWLLQDLGLGYLSGVTAYPDDLTLQKRQFEELKRQSELDRKLKGLEPIPVAKWKPEVAIRLVVDVEDYPVGLGDQHSRAITPKGFQAAAPALQAMSSRVIHLPKSSSTTNAQQMGGGGLYHKPILHVDELGLTSDKYLELNASLGSLPLKLSFSPMAPSRHRLMTHFEKALSSQKDLGFADSDIDDVRRLISDTSVYLLTVTMLASVLHLLFEFLAFKSDITFWKNNKSLRGLSVRSLFVDLFVQATITLYLADMDSSLLVLVPSALGVLIQGWKCQRATGLKVVFINGMPSIRMNRVEEEEEGGNPSASLSKKDEDCMDTTISESSSQDTLKITAAQRRKKEEDQETARKTAETMKVDRIAISHLSLALFPLVIGFSLKSLVMEEHHGWYSWAIASLTGTCYTFGFILMTPQLFINHHLKSVSHLPWKFLCFRFVNTFIDDLFAFVIRMPTMHRISCFRDDLVFFIYLYQRWVYPVDESRGMAFEDLAS